MLKVKLGARRKPAVSEGWRGGARRYPVLTRRVTLAEPTDDGVAIGREARRLLDRMPPDPIRLVGVGATHLVDVAASQLGLFEAPRERQRSVKLNRALDEIALRFGSRAVVRAGQEEAKRAGLSLQRKRGERDDEPPASKR
jgi:hypothetical protein